MVIKVERTEAGLVIPITSEMAKALEVTEGTEVEVLPVATDGAQRHATIEETLAAFERTLPHHENAYRALAK